MNSQSERGVCGAEVSAYNQGLEDAAHLMETHLCDLCATKEEYGVLPLIPFKGWATPGMQSRAAAIRALKRPTPTGDQ